MALIKININDVISSGNSMNIAKGKISSVKSSVSNIRWQIDGNIRNRSNIDTRITNAINLFATVESRIQAIKNVVDNAANNYNNTDRNVYEKGRFISERLIAVGKPIAGINALALQQNKNNKKDSWINEFLKGVINEAGYLGAVTSYFSGLTKIATQVSIGSVVAQSAKVGFSAIKDIVGIAKDYKNLGKVKPMLNPNTIKTSWAKKILGLKDTMDGGASKAASFGTRFYNNYQKTKAGLLDGFSFTKNAGKATVAWAGVALSGVVNYFSNQEEMKKGKMSQGRAVAETITETAVDVVKGLALGAVVTAGVAATAIGSAPVIAVAVGTVAVSMGLDAISKAVTGKDLTEAVSDGILDAGKAIGSGISSGFNKITNCFNNATKNFGAGWKFGFGF